MPSFELAGPPVEPVERRRLADELTVRILEHIRNEDLRPGDRLPATRVLAQRFAVATPTLREALRRLEATGALELRHGSGVYVRGEHGRLIVANPNRLRLDRSAILDLIAARELIEPHLAEGAARRAVQDSARLTRLSTSLDRAARALSDGTGDGTGDIAGDRIRPNSGARPKGTGDAAGAPDADDAELHAANMDFHREIGRLGGNQALTQVLDSLLDVYDQEQRHILALYNDRDQDLHVHQSILAAIVAGKPARAQRLMRDHLRDVRTVVSAALDARDVG
ncbi:FadR/GntR family transcriptional regulator [Rugosimonospora africana]|uniref:GntR family transcriptional regulator n=1 Tax=Rugosimonospora africana TaxID=556532 RepID=A0A8J3QNJ9_9ACTN|nr:GntR family transcriptional regulator [Rugosimonospora africana]GIH14204.1 GntR family transcriptional regulator [Rugosimonospora africana]